MGFRFRKQKGLGKWFRVNFTRNGVGFSLGPRSGGPRFNLSPRGQGSLSASIPGTGLSFSHLLRGHTPAGGMPPVDEQWAALERGFGDLTDEQVLLMRKGWRDAPDDCVDALAGDRVERVVAEAFLDEWFGGEIRRGHDGEPLTDAEQWAKIEAAWESGTVASGMLDDVRGLWARDPEAVLDVFLTSEEFAGCDRDTCVRFLDERLGPRLAP